MPNPGSGSFAVEINLQGCIDTSICASVTSFEASQDEAELISIFPNPANEFIQVNTPYQLFEFTLIDAMGKKVISETIHQSATINLSHLSYGIYFILLNNKNGEVRKVKLLISE